MTTYRSLRRTLKTGACVRAASCLSAIVLLSAPPSVAAALPVATVTTFSVSPGITFPSGKAVLTASVADTGGNAISPGLVRFCDAQLPLCEGTAIIGSAQLIGGNASLVINFKSGARSVKAEFQGTTAALASSSAAQTLTATGLLSTVTGLTATVTSPPGVTETGSLSVQTYLGTSGATPSGSIAINELTHNVTLATIPLSSVTPVGTFLTSTVVGTGVGPNFAITADINNDGIPDMIVPNSIASTTLTILLGDGIGNFNPAPGNGLVVAANASITFGPQGVAVGDFNEDGNLDLAVINQDEATLYVFLGDGKGGFTPVAGSPFSVGAGTAPKFLTVLDYDRDGHADIAVVLSGTSAVQLFHGDGTGSFTKVPATVATGVVPYYVASADMNNDGIPDLITADTGGSTVSVLLGKGDGTFTFAPGSPISVGLYPYQVALADLDNNGTLDVVAANAGSNSLSVLLNDGTGHLTQTASSPITVPFSATGVAAADLDLDGNADLVTVGAVNYAGSIVVLLGDGKGNFSPGLGSPLTAGLQASSVFLSDLNGDGRTDIISTAEYGTAVDTYLGQIASSFSLSDIAANLDGTLQVVAAYSGDSTHAASVSPPQTLVAINPDFSLTPTSTSITLKAGQQTSISVTLVTQGALAGTLAFSCSGLPNEAACAVSPSQITLSGADGTQTLPLTIITAGTSAQAATAFPGGKSLVFLGFVLPGGIWFVLPLGRNSGRKRRLGPLVTLVILATCCSALSGCGFAVPVTTPGNYTVTVVGNTLTNPAVSHAFTINVTVTQ